jgi:hypothetical protein
MIDVVKGAAAFFILALVCILLTACGGGVVVKERVRTVSVPVAVRPVQPEQIPPLPLPLNNRPASPAAAADLLLGKFCEVLTYVFKADPLLRVSAGLEPRDFPRYPQCEDTNGK